MHIFTIYKKSYSNYYFLIVGWGYPVFVFDL